MGDHRGGMRCPGEWMPSLPCHLCGPLPVGKFRVKLTRNLDQENLPGYPVVTSQGGTEGGQLPSWGHVWSHSPTRCEVRGCTTLGEADVWTAEGNAHGCAAVVGPAWNLQSHQELLINNQLDKAV